MRDDHDRRADRAATIRIRSTADLSLARRRLSAEFSDAGFDAGLVHDLVLAASELLTNALEAADAGTDVTLVASIVHDPRDVGGGRRVTVEIINSGDPLPGRLEVDSTATISASNFRGRGLVLAAKMGDLVVEGLIGGSRARFERVVDCNC